MLDLRQPTSQTTRARLFCTLCSLLVVDCVAPNCTSTFVLIKTRLTFLFTRQYKLWNDANLKIAIVTASAGTLL